MAQNKQALKQYPRMGKSHGISCGSWWIPIRRRSNLFMKTPEKKDFWSKAVDR